MRSALCDINIVLDVLLKRAPFFDDSYTIVKKIEKGEIEGFLSAISIDTIFYLIRRSGKSITESRDAIESILAIFSIAPVDEDVITDAFTHNTNDLEDAIQYESARAAQCEYIITRNKKDFPKGIIRVVSPAEYL